RKPSAPLSSSSQLSIVGPTLPRTTPSPPARSCLVSSLFRVLPPNGINGAALVRHKRVGHRHLGCSIETPRGVPDAQPLAWKAKSATNPARSENKKIDSFTK